LPVRFGYGVWGEHGVLLTVRHHLAHPGNVYLAVYDDR
jgi:hypothetical protein